MDEFTTSLTMISIFLSTGVVLPVFLMFKNENNPNSTIANKLILWMTMIFCMILILGIVLDFKTLSDRIREDITQYGFIAIMLFGTMFGIDQILKSKYIKMVRWKDLTVETVRKGKEDEEERKKDIRRPR